MLDIYNAVPTLSTQVFHSFQIVCQRAGGVGIHFSAHTVSGYVNSSTGVHTHYACLAQMLLSLPARILCS